MNSRLMRLLVVVLIMIGAVACAEEAVSPTGDPSQLITEARADLDAQNVREAIAKLEEAVRLNSNSVEARYLLGNAYAQDEQLSQAERQLTEVLRLDAAHTDARSNLGVVYYRQGKLQDAEKAFRTALKDEPNDSEIHYNLGGVLAALNRLDDAVAEFTIAIRLAPSLAEPYLGLGSVYKLQGQNAEAITALRKYVELSDDPTWREQAKQMLRELGETP